jgi:hypothetical protein
MSDRHRREVVVRREQNNLSSPCTFRRPRFGGKASSTTKKATTRKSAISVTMTLFGILEILKMVLGSMLKQFWNFGESCGTFTLLQMFSHDCVQETWGELHLAVSQKIGSPPPTTPHSHLHPPHLTAPTAHHTPPHITPSPPTHRTSHTPTHTTAPPLTPHTHHPRPWVVWFSRHSTSVPTVLSSV